MTFGWFGAGDFFDWWLRLCVKLENHLVLYEYVVVCHCVVFSAIRRCDLMAETVTHRTEFGLHADCTTSMFVAVDVFIRSIHTHTHSNMPEFHRNPVCNT